MYSILIQNQKTMESFHQFHPVFMDALNKKKIDVCQWMEAGTTIETTLPELYGLIEEKEEWRAVIVRIEEETDKLTFPAVHENPYDFIENAASDTRVKESTVPLIRLTQMLGGVPAPHMQFEYRQVQGKSGEPQMAYFSHVNEEDQKAYEALCEKYHFYGKRPSEIILVSLTYAKDIPAEKLQKTWKPRQEDESSAFWNRNAYPSICRFTFYEMQRQGSSQRTADLFQVWMAVLLLATNEIPSSSLQAYRLYRLELDLNREAMGTSMQKAVNRALRAKNYIRKSIRIEQEEKINQETDIPDYKKAVPVIFKFSDKKFHVGKHCFGIVSSSINSDMSQWNAMEEAAEARVRSAANSVERAFSQAADRIRSYSRYEPDQVLPLAPYQLEDFTMELEGLHEKIFDHRGQMRENTFTDAKELDARGKRVKDRILQRVTISQAVWGYTGMIFIYLTAFIPALALNWKNGAGLQKAVLYAALAGVLLYGAVEAVQLLLQRIRLHKDIKYFERFINGVEIYFSTNVSMFSHYMSAVASYMHGNSYLNILERKSFRRNAAQFHKQNHLTALNTFLMDLQSWTAAFYLPVDFENAEMDEETTIDMETAPYMHLLYTFGDEDSHKAFLNSTGDTVESPFIFVERLRIIREELYDDAG